MARKPARLGVQGNLFGEPEVVAVRDRRIRRVVGQVNIYGEVVPPVTLRNQANRENDREREARYPRPVIREGE